MLCLLAAPAAADPPRLSLPVDCRLGETCHVQQYADRDPGPGATDHRCGTLSYDGHKGTDFRLPDRAAMRAGVFVLAAAPGRVAGIRDGMPDTGTGREAADVEGRECGNGVVLEHEGGWQTQYCHMMQGSVTVAQGDSVAAGDVLGRVGLSGASEFPHLHLSVRDPDGTTVDPFDGRPLSAPCGGGEGVTLWADPPAYSPGGALSAGVLDRVPDYAEVLDGMADRARLPGGAGALVAWAHFFGLREGDVIEIALVSPSGERVVEDRHVMAKPRARQFRAAGRRADGGWAPGTWRTEARLLREGREVDRIAAEALIGP